jgi:hypothetical protein
LGVAALVLAMGMVVRGGVALAAVVGARAIVVSDGRSTSARDPLRQIGVAETILGFDELAASCSHGLGSAAGAAIAAFRICRFRFGADNLYDGCQPSA